MSSVFQKIFGKFRGRAGERLAKDVGGRDGAEMIHKILKNEVAAQATAEAAQDDAGPSVILRPVIRSGPSAAGWFGGEPMLPPNVDWPEIDGLPLCFLAQIDLAKLPADIWSGLGPREGHLVFFNHPNRCEPRVLHVTGNLAPRSADVPQPDHLWSRDADSPAPRYPYFNRFAVAATQHMGQMPDPVGWIPGSSNHFPHPFGGDKERPDLTQPQYQPFDRASLNLLTSHMSGAIDMRLTQCQIQLEKHPAEVARTKLLSIQSAAENTRKLFDQALRDIGARPVAPQEIAALVSQLGALQLPHFGLVRGPDGTVSDIEPVARALADPEGATWPRRYLAALDTHIFERFVQNPDDLPAAQRDRVEQICEFRSAYESGGMSHAPRGFIYTPHGQGSPNEVLLELSSSILTGWMWGDANALVILIDREALQRWDFGNVKGDITN